MTFRPPKGTDDILPPASSRWDDVLVSFDRLATAYGYEPVFTPIFESTEVFERGVGENTDIVGKEMYTFTDRGGRSLTLRPEATAGVMRAHLATGGAGVAKFYYSGPMFRYEKPQAGRRRQFWQVGIEYLGQDSPLADVEVIEAGARFFTEIGLPALEVRLNSLGDAASRARYRDVLVEYLRDHQQSLSDESQRRIDTNPLRVLDSKLDRDVVAGAPAPVEHLTAAAADHYAAVKEYLIRVGVEFREDPRLVRGLDYYTRTVFEYIAGRLDAAQDAVGGGGRYDGLAETLGGKSVPAVGFSLGIDRIMTALSGESPPGCLDVFVILADETLQGDAFEYLSRLRRAGVSADMDLGGRSVKAQFKAADRRRARVAAVVGAEWAEGQVTVRDMVKGEESLMGADQLIGAAGGLA